MNCTGNWDGGVEKVGNGGLGKKEKKRDCYLVNLLNLNLSRPPCQLSRLPRRPSSHKVHVNSNYPPPPPNILTQLAEMGHYMSSDV